MRLFRLRTSVLSCCVYYSGCYLFLIWSGPSSPSSSSLYVLSAAASPKNSYHHLHHTFKKNKLPEVSSTLLRTHRHYTQQPPHDGTLYHVLEVSPNATASEISKSYRQLSREWHPDKRRNRQRRRRRPPSKRRASSATRENEPNVDTDDDDDDEEEEADVKLQRIQEAYEVLKDDSTRLLYHKYGLIHTNMAAFLLTGGTYHHLGKATATPWILSPEQCQLLQLMGYYNLVPCNRTSSSSISATWSSHHHQDRILFLATQLVERIRPWMEGTISSSTLADVVATECDQLKHLPLGAQILRCIGRAYRHAGGKVLRRYARKRNCDSMLRKKENHHPLERRLLFVPNRMEEKIHDGLRHAKHLMTAAVASGRVVLSERIMEATTPSPKFKSNGAVTIEYQGEQEDEYNHDDFLLLGPASDHTSPSQEEMQHKERRKAQEAMLQALQVEALWKISKIELDRTIQEACELILSGTYFFFPSHQVPPPPPPPPPSTVPPPPIPKREQYGDHHHDVGDYDGWVGAAGTTVNTNVGILRAAEALALIGDVMVRCSKQGTAWME